MGKKMNGQLVPYDMVSPGWETEYIGEGDISSFESDQFYTYSADSEGNVMARYSMWGFSHANEENWNDEIRYINSLQSRLGPLDENIRRIRQHIAGLVCCHSGVPVTIDEILNIIGTGIMPEPAFITGCWSGSGTRSTQPGHLESMKVIEDVLKGFLDGKSEKDTNDKYPHVKGFIKRTYEWLGSKEELSELQTLLMRRMLLPFDFFTKRNGDMYAVSNDCFGEGGVGFKLDKQISDLANLPKIYPDYQEEYNKNLATISNDKKRELYKICGQITSCVAGMSDCHHNTFRYIESWIYSIGTLKSGIPTRVKSAEGNRLGQLLFAYALGIDRWLQGVPYQFLLMDLGHTDLGFETKNEILRVYLYLGEKRTPVNKWLVACLWHSLSIERSAGLYNIGKRHKEILEKAIDKGVSVREWMDSSLDVSSNERI